jgi:hypothetical protein
LKVGVLQLRLGDAEGVATRLGEAQAELEHAVGVNPVERHPGIDCEGVDACKAASHELREALAATTERVASQ